MIITPFLRFIINLIGINQIFFCTARLVQFLRIVLILLARAWVGGWDCWTVGFPIGDFAESLNVLPGGGGAASSESRILQIRGSKSFIKRS